MTETRIIMCGSRTWHDGHTIADEVMRLRERYGETLTIVHGDEPNGADEWIRRVCEDLSVRHEQYCASGKAPRHQAHARFTVFCVSSWDRDGLRAGPIRNTMMRDSGAIGIVAFRSEGESKGTDGMLRLCAAIPQIVYTPDGRLVNG